MLDLATLVNKGTGLLTLVEEASRSGSMPPGTMADIKSLHVQGRFLLRKIDKLTNKEYDALFSAILDPGAEEFNGYVEANYWRSELGKCVGILKAVLEAGTAEALDRTMAKIFISHGKFSGAFTKVEKFIRALGMLPIYDSEVPTGGKTINEHVHTLIANADFHIVLAKHETTDEAGRKLPNHNVIIEYDRLVETGSRNLIVFLEDECNMPAMLQDVIYVAFTEVSMDNAFTKLAAELKKQHLL